MLRVDHCWAGSPILGGCSGDAAVQELHGCSGESSELCSVSEITELPLEGKCLHLPWSINCFLEMPWYLSVVRTQCSHSHNLKYIQVFRLMSGGSQPKCWSSCWTIIKTKEPFAHPTPYSQMDNLVKSVRRGWVPRWDVSFTSPWLTGNPRAPFCCGCWCPLPRGPALLCDTEGGQQWVAVTCSAWTWAFLPPPTACPALGKWNLTCKIPGVREGPKGAV